MLTFKQEFRDIPVNEYSLHIIIFGLPYVTRGKNKKGRVKVILEKEELTVEMAVGRIFENIGYSVLKGDHVHFAGHMLNDESHEYIESLIGGDPGSLSKLLDNLVKRWDIYYAPMQDSQPQYMQEKKQQIRILVDFWKSNINIFRRWIDCYAQLSYDPGGAPDLFLWNPTNNRWCWIEVKSEGDSIDKNQWVWFQQFISKVAENVAIARVLPQ